MNVQAFKQACSSLKAENIKCTTHFEIRHEQRKDNLVPDIDGIRQMLISSEPVDLFKQDDEKFKLIFNLDEKYNLILVVSVKSTNPEITINLITCYKEKISRRIK